MFGIFYLLAADGFFQGQSLGKRIVGLHVRYISSMQGQYTACPYSQSAIRNMPFALTLFLSTLPILGKLFILLGLIFIGIEIYFMYSDDEGIRIGDIYAKTRVDLKP
ncbi:MAG: RDD family protein [Bdellovibrionota bacterium]